MWASKKSVMDILLAPFILLLPPGVDNHESAIKKNLEAVVSLAGSSSKVGATVGHSE